MKLLRRGAHLLEAAPFDGTAAGLCLLVGAFGRAVADGGDDRVEVRTSCGRVYAGAGCWVARDMATGDMHVLDGREIARLEPVDAPHDRMAA